MPIVIWGVLALVFGFGMLWLVARMARPAVEPLPADEEFPATVLQRVAGWSLAVGALLGVAAGALVVANGAEAVYDDDPLRLTFTALLMAILAVTAGASIWLKRRVERGGGPLDERDQEILARAPAVQAGAMLVTLAVWLVGLIERFHEAGAVPLFYLYLVFWSVVVVNLLGLPVGVLAGYRRR